MPLLFIFPLFFNTPCWYWWHSQVSRLFNYVSFSKSHFKLVVCSECQKQPKYPQQCRLSESEVEPFITQTKAASVAVLQLSFRKTILNLHLRVQTTSKQLTISIFARRIFRPTCMFTDKEDSGRGITTVTDKEIQSRNDARRASIKPGTWNIPEHSGTFRNIPEHLETSLNMKKSKDFFM